MNPSEFRKMIEDLVETQNPQLELYHNNLYSLPEEFVKLKHVTFLDLNLNNLTKFPPEIFYLTKLETLKLGSNHITVIPKEIRNLSNLKELKLWKNQIDQIPGEVCELKNLVWLDLSDNNISTLPEKIKNLRNLKWLDLRGNDELLIPFEILSDPSRPQEIINYYFEQKTSNSVTYLNEAKILVVGQGGVGKTSIVKRLLSEKFDPNQIKTEGINIEKFRLKTNAKEISLNIWDFGGQEIMHATHKFFLTKRSLYLLVLDARLNQEENRVEYWLRIIQAFGDNPPVIIVGNKTDQHPLDINKTGLKKKYPNIVAILETSASSGKGIKSLLVEITEQIENLPYINDIIPQNWFDIKKQIEDLENFQNFITYDIYQDICKKNNLFEESSQLTLIRFLHDLGKILYFDDDARLKTLGILNPQWATDGVYKILNSHLLFENKGVLTLGILDKILSGYEYPHDKRLFIVDLMRKFELCFEIESNNSFLVTDLLPKDEPFTGTWDNSLLFQYHYKILPANIITRFIVRMEDYIHQQRTLWRLGVVLRLDKNTALVKADTEDRKIYIFVSGEQHTRRDFLSVIRAQFDTLHRSGNFEVQAKVPIPKYPNVVVDYEHLLTLERKRIKEFIPEGLDESINVQELLSGIDPNDKEKVTGINFKSPESQSHSIPTKETEKNFIKKVIQVILRDIPCLIGRVLLDIVGRDKAVDSTAIIIGYSVIFLVIVLMLGVFDLDTLIEKFKDTWRFFFPQN